MSRADSQTLAELSQIQVRRVLEETHRSADPRLLNVTTFIVRYSLAVTQFTLRFIFLQEPNQIYTPDISPQSHMSKMFNHRQAFLSASHLYCLPMTCGKPSGFIILLLRLVV